MAVPAAGPTAPAPLRLTFDESLRPAEGRQVVCGVAGLVSSQGKDAAGFYFHLRALQQQGLWVDPNAPTEAADSETEKASPGGLPTRGSSSALDQDQPPPGVNWKGSKKKKKAKKKTEEEDYYALLGLQHERWMATDAQIKNAYRRTCLEHHPDKKLVGVTDEDEKQRIEDRFKCIQDAYENLSDPAKRREFDSIDEFDDSLPLECDPKDFFKVFAPAFRRNARWSQDSNVPDVGDENTPYATVDKFYDFWYTFKSWREFPHPDEEDVECAESREHRRWIERFNSKLREKSKKDEGKRLREFVEAAYKLDPRIVKKKEEDRAEKERKKNEKEAAKQRAIEEEQERKAAEEAAKQAAADAEKRKIEEARKVREAAKSAVKKERKRLRVLADGTDGQRLISEDDVEKLCTRLEQDTMAALCDTAEKAGDAEARRALLLQVLEGLLGKEEQEARAREAAKKEAEAAAKAAAKEEHKRKMAAMSEWSDEELRLLDKAVTKFPMGTPRRWEQVAAYVRTRTLEEVLLMVKHRQGASSARMRQQEDYKHGQKSRAEVKSSADLRVEAFTDVEVRLQGAAADVLLGADALDAAAAKVPAPHTIKAADVKAAEDTAAAAAAAAPPAAAEPAAKVKPAKKAAAAAAEPAAQPVAESTNGTAAEPATTDSGANGAAPAPAAAKKVVSAESGEWSEEQEVALVKALKQFGKELGQERWEKISGVVPGKSKAQCFKRFKELREVFRGKKGEGADME